jgi:hypothetical protein
MTESQNEPAPTEEPAAEIVSESALTVERAERSLDRGEDPGPIIGELTDLLAGPELTSSERSAATLALSRAHEVAGNAEKAIAVLEREMAKHADDPSWASKSVRHRLRELLTGDTKPQGVQPTEKPEATPFARLLTRYFPVNDDGQVRIERYMVGGDEKTTREIGAFDIGAGIRANREEACPLCTDSLSVSASRSRSDWLMIPAAERRFTDTLVVFYFDLGINRIPARYEHHLPMAVADIEKELEAGKSFVKAMEREGAPPVILIAAPRTAMLEEVESHLAEMDELPVATAYVDVDRSLRPSEIQGVMRANYFEHARSCYDDVLKEDPKAQGRVALRFAIQPDGVPTLNEVDVMEGTLDRAPFLDCLGAALEKLRFPAGGGEITVSYPIMLTPQ